MGRGRFVWAAVPGGLVVPPTLMWAWLSAHTGRPCRPGFSACLAERAVRLPEHLRGPEEHLSQRGAPGPLQWPDGDAAS